MPKDPWRSGLTEPSGTFAHPPDASSALHLTVDHNVQVHFYEVETLDGFHSTVGDLQVESGTEQPAAPYSIAWTKAAERRLAKWKHDAAAERKKRGY